MCRFGKIISYILCTEYIILQDRTKNLIYIFKKKIKSEKMNWKPKINQKDTKKKNQKPKINQKDTKNESLWLLSI